ncbi:PTS mannose/fructose/sorbose/N-acetylgalactosamine transporter subunit IIC [Thomasclavelia ramosa]|uniref:PTS mannose/fructose/sorbose/N-acetylgalactosamine transporter subunit IIC n=1 Tax=Thomasclavelia ramosa TaxID=1547 RepID=UPI000E4DD4E3|nr:PTS sugar transporter subunit IIC [Thomasclavelia ramosa]RGQ38075.1 PTS sugar transporter subunit IIC [Thomasclavelia ramosa]RGQ52781.1 PTS sugar transporter subunit IIC [Thomasclavelia ramosa]
MLFKSIVVGLIAVFARIDSRMLGRLNFERPLISCTLVGLFLGDVTKGLAVGAQMEMVSLGFMSIGASGFDMNMGSIAGCALVIMTGANIETALAIATPMTLLITLIETGASVVRISMTHMIDGYVENGEFNKAKMINIFWGPMLYAVCTFVPVFMAVYLGEDVINAIVRAVPEFVLNGITLGANLVAFFGFAMLLSVMINKKNAIYFFLGFAIAAYSGLSLTSIAIISVVLAVLFYQMKYGDRPLAMGGHSTQEIDELEDELDD